MRIATAIATLLLACLATTARADAMRCGSKLVTFGDTRSAVRSLCGEPSDIQTRSILRRPTYNLHGRVVYFGDGYVEIRDGLAEGDAVVTSANFLIDAESNLKAALKGFAEPGTMQDGGKAMGAKP